MDVRSSPLLGSAPSVRAVYAGLLRTVREAGSVSLLRAMKPLVPVCPARVRGLPTLAAPGTLIFGGSSLLQRNGKPDLRLSSSLQRALKRPPSFRPTERKLPSTRTALETMKSGCATAMAPAQYRSLH